MQSLNGIEAINDSTSARFTLLFENNLGGTTDHVSEVVYDTAGITADATQGVAVLVPVPAPLLGSGLSGLVSGLALALFLITGRATLRRRQA